MSSDKSPGSDSFDSSNDDREVCIIDDLESIEEPTELKTVYDCFEYATSEYKERGTEMSKDLVVRAAYGDYYLKGAEHTLSEDFANLSKMSRVFDLVLTDTCSKPDRREGKNFLLLLCAEFKDELLTSSEVQMCYEAIKQNRASKHFCSGGESDPLCSFIHIPRAI